MILQLRVPFKGRRLRRRGTGPFASRSPILCPSRGRPRPQRHKSRHAIGQICPGILSPTPLSKYRNSDSTQTRTTKALIVPSYPVARNCQSIGDAVGARISHVSVAFPRTGPRRDATGRSNPCWISILASLNRHPSTTARSWSANGPAARPSLRDGQRTPAAGIVPIAAANTAGV